MVCGSWLTTYKFMSWNIKSYFLLKNLEKIRFHGADLDMIVGMGGLGIIISNYNQVSLIPFNLFFSLVQSNSFNLFTVIFMLNSIFVYLFHPNQTNICRIYNNHIPLYLHGIWVFKKWFLRGCFVVFFPLIKPRLGHPQCIMIHHLLYSNVH